MQEVIVALCEGVHDVAFISRVLLSNSYVKSSNNIGGFPSPFNDLFLTKYRSHKIDNESLDYSPNFLLPKKALEKGDKLVFVHECGGDAHIAVSRAIIEQYSSLKGADDFTANFDFQLKFVFIYDADEIGVEARLNKIAYDFALPPLTQGILVDKEQCQFGAFVLSGINNKGRLEDILLSIIQERVGLAFTEGEKYLDACKLPLQRTKEFIIKPCGSEDYKGRAKFDKQKALLSLVGQLQFSGATNTVFIEKSDVFKPANITAIGQFDRLVGLF